MSEEKQTEITYTVSGDIYNLVGVYLTKDGKREYEFNGTGTAVIYTPAIGRCGRRTKGAITFTSVTVSSDNKLLRIW